MLTATDALTTASNTQGLQPGPVNAINPVEKSPETKPGGRWGAPAHG